MEKELNITETPLSPASQEDTPKDTVQEDVMMPARASPKAPALADTLSQNMEASPDRWPGSSFGGEDELFEIQQDPLGAADIVMTEGQAALHPPDADAMTAQQSAFFSTLLPYTTDYSIPTDSACNLFGSMVLDETLKVPISPQQTAQPIWIMPTFHTATCAYQRQ